MGYELVVCDSSCHDSTGRADIVQTKIISRSNERCDVSGKISEKIITRDATIGPSWGFRCFFNAAGTGVSSLSPTLKITDIAGANMTLVLDTDYTRTERANIPGDYEIHVALSKVSSFGIYTIELDSNDLGAGTAEDSLPVLNTFGAVTSASATNNWTDLPSTMTDFYKYSFQKFMTGSLTGAGPRQVTSSASGGSLTTESWPSAPSSGDVFMMVDI